MTVSIPEEIVEALASAPVPLPVVEPDPTPEEPTPQEMARAQQVSDFRFITLGMATANGSLARAADLLRAGTQLSSGHYNEVAQLLENAAANFRGQLGGYTIDAQHAKKN